MKKDLKNLKNIAKKILSKKTLKKIKEVVDEREKIDILKHSIKVNLDLKYKTLTNMVYKKEKEDKEVFFDSIKLNLLNLKIKYFNITYHKKDFEKIMKLFKKLEKEIKKI